MNAARNRKQSRTNAQAAVAILAAAAGQAARAVVVYSDDFNRATLNGSTFQYATTIQNYVAGETSDGGVSILNNDVLELTHSGTAAANRAGMISVATPTSAFVGFNPTLAANVNSELSWTFNMRTNRGNLSGFAAPPAAITYGMAFVLGGTDANFYNAGQGYAVVVGNSSSPDPFRLVRYTSGVSGGPLTLIASGGTQNVTTDYYSVKVTYNTTNGRWDLAYHEDGTTGFADPSTVPFTSLGFGVDTTYANTALTQLGAYWQHGAQSGAGQVAQFDNFKLDVSAASVPPPRTLYWDPNGAAAPDPSDGAGNWEAAGAWYDGAAAHVAWESARPDNAVIGTAAGTGTHTITLGSPQTAGSVVFPAGAAVYTIAGAQLALIGDSGGVGLSAARSVTFDTSVAVNGAQKWTVATGATLTINAATAGASALTIDGGGVVVLNAASPSRTGTTRIENATVRLTAVDGTFTSGIGRGTTTVASGGVMELANIAFGASGNQAPDVIMLVGSTLRATGTSSFFRSGSPMVTNGTGVVKIEAAGFEDVLSFGTSIRNLSPGTVNNSTIAVSGLGRVVLQSGGISANNTYNGQWLVNGGGVLQIGPNVANTSEALNALGFKGDASGGDAKQANAVRVENGVLAGAVNAPNPGRGTVTDTPSFFRSGVTLAGGALATTGIESSNWGGDFITAPGVTSFVYVYDPVSPGVARDVHLVAGAAGTNNNAATTRLEGKLQVLPGALYDAGTFHISRDGGTVEVTPGAELEVALGAKAVLSGKSILSDGTDSAILTLGGKFTVAAGNADAVRVAALNFFGGKLDLTDNDLIVDYAAGETSPVETLKAELANAYNAGKWDGVTGIGSSAAAAQANHITAIGYLDNTAGTLGTYRGQSLDTSAILLKYTYVGDANLDGAVTRADFDAMVPGAGGKWSTGDFNYDGVVTSDDFALASLAFALQGAPLAHVPEPGTVAVLSVGATLVATRRRRG